jgi:hypothetical protein
MKTRVIIEYDLPAGDRVVVRDREEQRWTAKSAPSMTCYLMGPERLLAWS